MFYLGERVFHMDRLTVQTLMYLKLSVAGHLTIFLTRTRGPFWSIRPAKILLIAVVGTPVSYTHLDVYKRQGLNCARVHSLYSPQSEQWTLRRECYTARSGMKTPSVRSMQWWW